jgi:hypothetical protein
MPLGFSGAVTRQHLDSTQGQDTVLVGILPDRHLDERRQADKSITELGRELDAMARVVTSLEHQSGVRHDAAVNRGVIKEDKGPWHALVGVKMPEKE